VPGNLREADRFNDKYKPVSAEVECPACGNLIEEYTTKSHGNERVMLHVKHPDGRQCQQSISLLDAHMIEASASRKQKRREY
jgi:hypothetical protein